MTHDTHLPRLQTTSSMGSWFLHAPIVENWDSPGCPILLPRNIAQLQDWLAGNASSGGTDPERGPTIRDIGL
ncbi:uncharacterized protein N7500_006812 [Penicillium coprophilum]|uniref:uncharacterized protein n=1 Tax=Penicillium coprophilum TaxID=36646 RepID=UPI00238A1668|nr:uncharacterized protein N7500_006812 [Penicillium coprophilum]KAJ5164982.1 hypothetical protein N7500_006812 [Penicillium coprophilum]